MFTFIRFMRSVPWFRTCHDGGDACCVIRVQLRNGGHPIRPSLHNAQVADGGNCLQIWRVAVNAVKQTITDNG
jgi:hypothetical protein